MTSSQLCHRQCCVCCSWSFATWIQQTSFQHEIAEDVGLCVAAVAADGGDELLHAVLGAAVAGGPWLVLQRRILLAGPHAHAGASPAAFHPAWLYHDDQTAIIQMRLWICFMLFIPACPLQTYDVFEGQVHACPAATTLCFQAKLEDAVALWSWLQSKFGCGGFELCAPAALGAVDTGTHQLSACYISQRSDIQFRVNQLHLFEHLRIYCQ